MERWRGWMKGMPSPTRMGMTWMRNSSISPWSKKEAMISPPPITQMFAGLGAQVLGEGFDWLVDEFEGRQWRFAALAGKNVVLDFGAETGVLGNDNAVARERHVFGFPDGESCAAPTALGTQPKRD
jgi:hypothetical protein